MIQRGQNFKSIDLDIVGSSTFGRYPKINASYTYNMFISDNFLVPYPGYKVAYQELGTTGRGLYSSAKQNRMIAVFDDKVYLINIFYDQNKQMTFDKSAILIGRLLTAEGTVYITENNKPQIAISDGVGIYIYDPTLTPIFKQASLSFVPGYITFHDTYFLCAAQQDNYYLPAATNTWRLSGQNNGLVWNDDSFSIGLIQTKPDSTQAVVRFPSKGNMIIVMGKTVTEFWTDTGSQLFPYTRTNQMSIDYGCLNPATIAENDEMVVWLASNEQSGPIIIYSTGGPPQKITTDGIDYYFSQLIDPSDSRAFLYRQDGHLIYHINFYTDNVSLFYDFNTQKFFHACDQNLNHYIADKVAFFNNQYYFITSKDGNLYSFDTVFTTYNGAMIPRMRTCKNIRLPSQEWFIANDVGFTIESGETDYQQQNVGEIFLVTEDGKELITEGGSIFITTEDGNYIAYENGGLMISQQTSDEFSYLISEQHKYIYTTPRVDLSISIDGGASYSNSWGYDLPSIGIRKNKLMWWQLGAANDLVCQFRFWGLGRFVASNGQVNIRQ